MFRLPEEEPGSPSRFSSYNIFKLSILKEFKESLFSYISDRGSLFSFYGNSIKILFRRLNFVKSSIFQKFYWGRGNLYKPLLTVLVVSIFSFSFIMIWILSGSPFSRHIKIQSLSSQKPTISRSILSSSEGNTNSLSLTKAKVGTSYGLVNWYKVQPNDTIESIAKKFNTTSSVIEWSNNLSGKNIYVGEELNIIPISGITYVVQPKDTLESIAQKFNVSVNEIEDWNLLNNSEVAKGQLSSGETIFIPNAIIQGSQTQSTSTSSNTNQTSNNFSNFSSDLVNSSVSVKTGQENPSLYYYSQLNPSWANVRLGYSGYTISEVGCLITDIAMVGKYYGYNINPASIAENPGNFSGPLFNWNGLGIFNVDPLGNLYGGYVNWSEVNSELLSGHPVIVSIDYDYHYVLLTSILSNGEYVMNDPARGSGLIFNNYYSTSSVTQAILFTPRG
jgi:LysM repeat protein